MTLPLPTFSVRLHRLWQQLLLLVAGCGILAAPATAPAQELQEYSIKAALLFNIAKYTDWPPEAFPDSDAPIVIGVLGEDPFGDVLETMVRGRTIKGRPLIIRRGSGVAPFKDAHVVFVSPSQPQAAQDCAALESFGVLTVGDTRLTEPYTVFHLAVEGDRVVFTVDLKRAARTGAMISSQLLKFAKEVKRGNQMAAR